MPFQNNKPQAQAQGAEALSVSVMASQSEASIFATARPVWIASVALRPRNDTGGLIPQSLTRPTPVIPSESEEPIA